MEGGGLYTRFCSSNLFILYNYLLIYWEEEHYRTCCTRLPIYVVVMYVLWFMYMYNHGSPVSTRDKR